MNLIIVGFKGSPGEFFGIKVSELSFVQHSEYLAAIPEPTATAGAVAAVLAAFALFRKTTAGRRSRHGRTA